MGAAEPSAVLNTFTLAPVLLKSVKTACTTLAASAVPNVTLGVAKNPVEDQSTGVGLTVYINVLLKVAVSLVIL